MLTEKRKYLAAILAACLCLTMIAGCAEKPEEAPNTGLVQMGNPLVEVASAQEMEAKLGYSAPVLDKTVEIYFVLAAQQARIRYADGAEFNMKQGSGDISGIYGGVAEKTETICGVSVTFRTYEEIHYAIWEKDGFTYSLTGGENLADEVAALIEK